MTWTAAAIADAAAAWVYLPADAPHRVTDEFAVVAYPDHWSMPTQASLLRSERPAAGG